MKSMSYSCENFTQLSVGFHIHSRQDAQMTSAASCKKPQVETPITAPQRRKHVCFTESHGLNHVYGICICVNIYHTSYVYIYICIISYYKIYVYNCIYIYMYL